MPGLFLALFCVLGLQKQAKYTRSQSWEDAISSERRKFFLKKR